MKEFARSKKVSKFSDCSVIQYRQPESIKTYAAENFEASNQNLDTASIAVVPGSSKRH
jgi:hypothetical protein